MSELIQVPIWTLPKRKFAESLFGKVFNTCISGAVTIYQASAGYTGPAPTTVRDYIFSPHIQSLIATGSFTCMYDTISNSDIAMSEFSIFFKPMENFSRDPSSTEYKRRTDNVPITFEMRTDEVAQASLACIADIGIPLLQALVDYKTTLFDFTNTGRVSLYRAINDKLTPYSSNMIYLVNDHNELLEDTAFRYPIPYPYVLEYEPPRGFVKVNNDVTHRKSKNLIWYNKVVHYYHDWLAEFVKSVTNKRLALGNIDTRDIVSQLTPYVSKQCAAFVAKAHEFLEEPDE